MTSFDRLRQRLFGELSPALRDALEARSIGLGRVADEPRIRIFLDEVEVAEIVPIEAGVEPEIRALQRGHDEMRREEDPGIHEVIRMLCEDLPGGADVEASEVDHSPDDMTAHVAGLAVQRLKQLLGERSQSGRTYRLEPPPREGS